MTWETLLAQQTKSGGVWHSQENKPQWRRIFSNKQPSKRNPRLMRSIFDSAKILFCQSRQFEPRKNQIHRKLWAKSRTWRVFAPSTSQTCSYRHSNSRSRRLPSSLSENLRTAWRKAMNHRERDTFQDLLWNVCRSSCSSNVQHHRIRREACSARVDRLLSKQTCQDLASWRKYNFFLSEHVLIFEDTLESRREKNTKVTNRSGRKY